MSQLLIEALQTIFVAYVEPFSDDFSLEFVVFLFEQTYLLLLLTVSAEVQGFSRCALSVFLLFCMLLLISLLPAQPLAFAVALVDFLGIS